MAISGKGFAQDLVTRFVNVHWGGAVLFIYSTELGNELYYVSFKDKNDIHPKLRTITLPEPPDISDPDSPTFAVNASSYQMITTNEGKPNEKRSPTFLVAGTRVSPHMVDDGIGNLVKVFDYKSIIYKSKDGLAWSVAYEKDAIRVEYDNLVVLESFALVWNPPAKRFYFDQFYFSYQLHTSLVNERSENTLSSSDGEAWETGASSNIGDKESPEYVSIFPPYCSHNDCVDDFNQHVPDGNMGKDKDITIKPVKPLVYFYSDAFTGLSGDISNEVEIVQESESHTTTVSIPGFERVNCAATAGGILMVGGDAPGHPDAVAPEGIGAFSLDNGKTWITLKRVPRRVITMVAALLSTTN